MSLKLSDIPAPVNKTTGINDMIADSKTQVDNFINNLTAISSEEIQVAVAAANEMGTPFFTMESMKDTVHPLAQMLRYLFITNNITEQKFKALHEQLALQTCMSGNHKTSEHNNTKRAMVQPEITWNTFEKVLSICGFELTDINIVLKHRATGVVNEISRNEVAKSINEYNNSKSKHEFTRVIL